MTDAAHEYAGVSAREPGCVHAPFAASGVPALPRRPAQYAKWLPEWRHPLCRPKRWHANAFWELGNLNV